MRTGHLPVSEAYHPTRATAGGSCPACGLMGRKTAPTASPSGDTSTSRRLSILPARRGPSRCMIEFANKPSRYSISNMWQRNSSPSRTAGRLDEIRLASRGTTCDFMGDPGGLKRPRRQWPCPTEDIRHGAAIHCKARRPPRESLIPWRRTYHSTEARTRKPRSGSGHTRARPSRRMPVSFRPHHRPSDRTLAYRHHDLRCRVRRSAPSAYVEINPRDALRSASRAGQLNNPGVGPSFSKLKLWTCP